MTITALPEAPSRSDDPDTFVAKADAFVAALGTFVDQLNDIIATTIAATNYNSVSTTSVAIGTGSKAFTAEASKLLQAGQFITVASAANPANYMFGQVDSYDAVTGALVADIASVGGSGTYADWVIALSPAGTYVPLTTANVWAAAQTFSAIPVLSGGGVKFPSVQVASADANTLDDYEEGTFTPTLTFGGGSTGLTYGTRVGRYTKWGRMVNIQLEIVLTAKGSSTGLAAIGGLPYASTTGNPNIGSALMGTTTGMVVPSASVGASSSSVILFDFESNAFAQIDHSAFNNTTSVYVNLNYYTA